MGMGVTACAAQVIEQACRQPIEVPWRPACEESDMTTLARILEGDSARHFVWCGQCVRRQEGIVQRIDYQRGHRNAAQELPTG